MAATHLRPAPAQLGDHDAAGCLTASFAPPPRPPSWLSVAAVISYRHAYELVRTHGGPGRTAHLVPFTVDGLILAASMAILDASRPSALYHRRQRGARPLGRMGSSRLGRLVRVLMPLTRNTVSPATGERRAGSVSLAGSGL
ncbi:DUF2637 domain-containing protein [Actinomadura rugatobispora]|uniref:DUF2637 domain-containing protein n=1 Tax=Actinomadura rugatobispora TaxID=1994 RepID=A0ABW1AAH2_9ACTN